MEPNTYETDLMPEELYKKWKSKVEYLELQWKLAKMDAKDAFEEKKQTIRELADKMDEELDQMETISAEAILDVKKDLDELRLETKLGAAEASDTYEAQQQKLQNLLTRVSNKVKKFESKGEDAIDDLKHEVKEYMEWSSEQFKILSKRYAQQKEEAAAISAEVKEKTQQKLNEMRKKYDAINKSAEENWEKFSTEMSQSFDHAKKAVQGIFS